MPCCEHPEGEMACPNHGPAARRTMQKRWATSDVVPEAAIEAASHALASRLVDPTFGPTHTQLKARERDRAVIAIEAALPHLVTDQMVRRAALVIAGEPRCYCDDDWRVPTFLGCPKHGDGEWPAKHQLDQARKALTAALTEERQP